VTRPAAGPAPASDPDPDLGADGRRRRAGTAHGAARPPRRAGARRLLLVCLALATSGAALWAAARLPWFVVGIDAVGRGTVPVTATGADLVPALPGVALLAVAAVAAAVALAGAARRAVGGVIAAAGLWVAVALGGLLLAPPTATDLAALPGAPAGGTAVAGAAALRVGPLPAGVGVVLLLAAAAALMVGEPRLPRLGARYTARPAEEPPASVDPDRAAWDALDAGRDPTADLPPDATPGTRSPERPPAERHRTDGGGPDRPD
jgi:uncharacterized membrane protein (TIGR02234 family)